jgi:hypothetical protein
VALFTPLSPSSRQASGRSCFGSGSLLTAPAAGKINSNSSTPIECTSALTLTLVFGAAVLLDA